MTNASISGDWELYLRAFRQDAHQLLAWGYADVRQHIHPDDEEEVITACIAEAVRRRIDNPATPERFSRYALHNVHFISPTGQTGKRQLRLDLMLEQCGIRPHRHFVFEAKRLRKGSHPISGYTGSDGVGRFVSGNYALENPEAAMVGYMQNGDVKYWLSEIQRVFTSDTTNGNGKLRIVERLRVFQIVPELTDEWSSGHQRPNGRKIRLFHIVLDCR